jgi:hypothetical protein
MARIAKRLTKGTLTDSNATLYTVPGSTSTTVVSMVLCNTSSSNVTVTITLAGTSIIEGHNIVANDSLFIELKNAPTILETTELIEGSSDTDAVVDYYITGVEEA